MSAVRFEETLTLHSLSQYLSQTWVMTHYRRKKRPFRTVHPFLVISFCAFTLQCSLYYTVYCLDMLTYLLTYLLTPWCRVLPEQLTGLQLVKKFPAFHGTRRLITALTSILHLSLSWASPIESTCPHPTSWRSILILSTHLRLGLPSGLFPSGFPTKTLYTALSSPIRATCPAHLIILHFITRTFSCIYELYICA